MRVYDISELTWGRNTHGKQRDRLEKKRIAIAYMGGVCRAPNCPNKFVWGEEDRWQFAHKIPLKTGCGDHDDRWTYWSNREPFTQEWLEWVSRVEPTCSQRCNRAVEQKPVCESIDVEMSEDASMPNWKQTSMDL